MEKKRLLNIPYPGIENLFRKKISLDASKKNKYETFSVLQKLLKRKMEYMCDELAKTILQKSTD